MATFQLHHQTLITIEYQNVVLLLGEPVQKAISSESGIDLVLDSLNDITSGFFFLITRVHPLLGLNLSYLDLGDPHWSTAGGDISTGVVADAAIASEEAELAFETWSKLI
ncbi:hypothetical protein EVAR_38478_1 [Eumeta japonica]|uniref:Uncharacterized protein n=1 Tax=Eumeta variegata TaxID=151549 RepID=A0A4C1WP80_EUMVA|nr:hypothetical protein EVAR_38478_1 [Eumeta japonica]